MTESSCIRFVALFTGVFCLGNSSLFSETTFYTPKEDLDGMHVKVAEQEGLPNVLLIGDSISIGYTKPVVAELEGVANVKRPKANCGDTNRGLEQLNAWLGDTKWDVIHFNWGLHDLCYRHPDSKVQGNRDKVNGTQSVLLDEYVRNLEELVKRLENTGAVLVWASTTVIPEGEAGRFVEDAVRYNEAAEKVMKAHGIPIDDLHAFSATITAQFTEPGNVHFTKDGYAALGRQVAGSIRTALNK